MKLDNNKEVLISKTQLFLSLLVLYARKPQNGQAAADKLTVFNHLVGLAVNGLIETPHNFTGNNLQFYLNISYFYEKQRLASSQLSTTIYIIFHLYYQKRLYITTLEDIHNRLTAETGIPKNQRNAT